MNSSDEIFDYIIVGAGSAGCVLANRLSEDRSLRVALIEAGPNDSSPLISTPALVGTLMNHRRFGWGYSTVPQAHLGGRRVPMPRGKVVGGSSSTNGMVYFRGHPLDYDDWAAAGNDGWSYRHVLPYFLRSEANDAFPASPYHGADGPMRVTDIKEANPLDDVFLGAATDMQFRSCDDFNGPDPEGFGMRQVTIRDGRRESTATAFLAPARTRANLNVVPEALVHRLVLVDGRATGVEIEIGGERRLLSARREIVLSAGTFGSPAILQRSGLGSGQMLRQHGIAVMRDLPGIGANLQDHVTASVHVLTQNITPYGLSLRAVPRNIGAALRYLLLRRGQLASNAFEAHGLVKSHPELDRPDLQLIFQPARRPKPPFPLPVGHGYGINIALLKPSSRGTVMIGSQDPRGAPLIDPNFFSSESDLTPLLAGISIARSILNSPRFTQYDAAEVSPGPEVVSRDELVDYIRASAATVHHAVGTCAMGQDEDAVVDEKLRLRGIDGVRIVDASIFPRIVAGNTNAPVIMVAEKAADMILNRPALSPMDIEYAGRQD